MYRIIFNPGIIILIILFMGNAVSISANSDIEGYVRDAQANAALPGANVILLETSLGAATDVEGKYVIRNVPPGSYTVRVTYVGYESVQMVIQVGDNIKLEQDFNLEPVSLEGETIVVTAQATGQKEAINKQLSSLQILNAVSSARIQELPDANAAESVGRLPGVSILRSGGEGDRVVVRGLAPQYNEITINGVKLSSSDQNNRSVDLSMISSNMLEAIQVSKTVSADMDANVIGGVVNFDLREAQANETGAFKYNFLLQGAYNGLPNAQEKYGNYKLVGTAENRFFDSRLGVFVQGSFERRNLSSNELGAVYGSAGNSQVDYLVQNITLDDIFRDRIRGNGVLSLDYKLSDGVIKFSNLFSTGTTETNDRQQFYNVTTGQNTSNFTANYYKSTLNSITNLLKYERQIWLFNTVATLSHSYSETKNPKDWSVVFTTSPAGLTQFGNARNVNPVDVVQAATHDTNVTLLRTISTNYGFTRERILSAGLDFDTPLYLSNSISAVIKFGAKYQYQKRSNDINVTNGEPFGLVSGGAIISQLQSAFPWFEHLPGDNLRVSMSPFIDRSYDYGEFLKGDYKLLYPLDFSRLQSMMDYVYDNQLPLNATYNYNIGASLTNDYWGQEDISAAYLMATINVGQLLTITPGIRYQQLKTVYTGVQGLQGPTSYADYEHRFIKYTAYHPYWLPNLIVRFKPLDWFDVRLAYSNTLSYPDYASLSPRINVVSTGTLQWNGFKLNPIESKNYDVYLSFYENKIGLFTAGAFLKQIKNLIYAYNFYPPTAEKLAEYYPEWAERTPSIAGPNVSTYINNSYTIDNYGIELDWQTHFWYLPGPLSGLVMSVNFTHIFSKAEYPYELTTSTFPRRYIDTSYFAPLLYQPDDIVNLTIGYDFKGFSIRLSSIYSSKIFTGPTQWPQLRAYTSAYNKWDISLKQDLPFVEGLEVFCNMNNISSAEDESVISAPTKVPSRKQSYYYMIELGLRGQF
jgi:TonB-dependent receptor